MVAGFRVVAEDEVRTGAGALVQSRLILANMVCYCSYASLALKNPESTHNASSCHISLSKQDCLYASFHASA